MSADINAVCVVGLGYIGLPTAALIASSGLKVTGVDIDPTIIETVNKGHIHIAEAELDGLVQKVVLSEALVARDTPVPADVFIIAVPTPLSAFKKPQLGDVFGAIQALAPHLRRGNLLILESTCPVGTTEEVRDRLAKLRPDLTFPGSRNCEGEADVAIAYCPERVLPGRILIELVQNDRCIGGISPTCTRKARQFYELFVRGTCVETNARTAELVKLSENAFRDTNIAFANELSMISDHLGVDVWEVIEIANRHPRVSILNPGPGVGGHCIAVDPWFIVHTAPREARLIRTAREVNDRKARYVFEHAKKLIKSNPDLDVACLGLAFKANVDDQRESPALKIVEQLADTFGDRIGVVEPYAHELPKRLSERGARKLELDDALERSGILILLVDHEPFRKIDAKYRDKTIVYDTRGVWRA